ncbi:MAG: hypothetical protein H7145_03970 [Akkermansiaceae bacterium]|nr:hypothetical protein [Armatimonadota bacterium]
MNATSLPSPGQAGRDITNGLAVLAAFRTEDLRDLLHLLVDAQMVAERIDASRGHVVDEKIALQLGESCGTNLAESISVLASRGRHEAFGATAEGPE